MNNPLVKVPPTLGFGYMRLPEKNGAIDLKQVTEMADLFLEAGFTYFDTAWGYMDGLSEEAIRKTVVERHPRDAFTIATKFPIWAVDGEADVQRIFNTQLERTGAGFFDYYMIHAVGSGNLDKINQYGIWAFIAEQKRKGLARHIGFSFHDTADVLERVLDDHPEVEFVQLQLNYADWEDDRIQARLCYEACMKRNIPIVLMEPVKGGSLAMMSPEVQEVLKAARPDDSIASWAMRFCGSLPGLVTVLSGMSDTQQVRDNIKTMKDFEPLTDEERKILDQVMVILGKTPLIPCTQCRYCVEDCPQKINIPGIFGCYNDYILYQNLDGMKRHYRLFEGAPAKASDCIRCGVCEVRCPQKIAIIDRLADCAAVFED